MQDIRDIIKPFKNKILLCICMALVFIVIVIIYNNDTNIHINGSNNSSNDAIVDITKLEGITKIISENIKLQNISDIELRSDLLDIVESGISGSYTVKNRHFVVLTTGSKSLSDITYDVELDHEYNTVIKYKISEDTDGLNSIRYKIIEFTSNDVILKEDNEQALTVDNPDGQRNGIASIMVFDSSEDSDSRNVYILEENMVDKSLSNELLNSGLYTVVFKDNKIVSNETLNYIDIYNCSIRDKIEQSRNTYNVVLPDGNILISHVNELNTDSSIRYNLRITYDTSVGFLAEIL